MNSVEPLKVTNEIAALLSEDTRLNELTGGNIFPVVAPLGTPGNIVTYQRDGYKEQGTKTGVAERQPMVNIACISPDYLESQNMACLVCDILCGTFQNPYMRIALEDSTEDYAGNKFIQVLRLSVTV